MKAGMKLSDYSKICLEYKISYKDIIYAKTQISEAFAKRTGKVKYDSGFDDAFDSYNKEQLTNALIAIIAGSKDWTDDHINFELVRLFKETYCAIYGLNWIRKDSPYNEPMSYHKAKVLVHLLKRKDSLNEITN